MDRMEQAAAVAPFQAPLTPLSPLIILVYVTGTHLGGGDCPQKTFFNVLSDFRLSQLGEGRGQ